MTTFRNPVLAGDRPDPAIIKVGDEYWMTYSSFEAAPGLLLYRSTDLVNWTYECAALPNPVGNTFAVDIAEHDGHFFIYIPFIPTPWSTLTDASIFVIHAPSMSGPWSEPIDLGIRGAIDPGHAVGEDGRRYLFVSGVRRIALTDDGLSTFGELEQVYDGWRYPDEWVTESYALEGPKLFRKGRLVLPRERGGRNRRSADGPHGDRRPVALGARAVGEPPPQPDRTDDGCRGALVVARTCHAGARTRRARRRDWWMVSHGYENGYRTLGRQILLEPIRWSEDAWPEAVGCATSAGSSKRPPGPPRSRDQTGSTTTSRRCEPGERWAFHAPGPANPIACASTTAW